MRSLRYHVLQRLEANIPTLKKLMHHRHSLDDKRFVKGPGTVFLDIHVEVVQDSLAGTERLNSSDLSL